MNDWDQKEPKEDIFVIRTRRLFRWFLLGVVGIAAVVWSGVHRGWFQSPGGWREEIDLRYLAPFETSDWFTVIPSDYSDGKKLVLEVRKISTGNKLFSYSPFDTEKTFDPKNVRSINETQVPGNNLVGPFNPAKLRNLSIGIRRFNREHLGGAATGNIDQLFIEMKRGNLQYSQDLSSTGFFKGKIKASAINHTSIWVNKELKLMSLDTTENDEFFRFEFVVVERQLPSYD